MAFSPPGSPTGVSTRPMSGLIRPPRSSSRMSVGSKAGGGSRASDEDGKTAVKVAVRVRPPLKPTDPGYELIPQRFQRSTVHVTSPTSLAVDVPQGQKLFVFDRVFPETVDQEGIWEYLNDSVNSFVQGYNVSILAYGQSGAGKSYTMGTSGPNEQNNPKAMGIIPRAAQLLFEKLDCPKHSRTSSSVLRTPARFSMASPQSFNKQSLDKNWQIKATYVEIYNEQLRDLLLPESIPMSDRGNVTIREDPKGRIILTGLHQVNINSFEDLLGALNFGSAIRQTDATAINAKSSRSHAVFSLNLVQRKSPLSMSSTKEKRLSMPVEALSVADASVTTDSKLHFVDLAGSERLKNTGASGERAKEGISINAGLASLGKVISQLSSRQPGAHVSYRDSKLTRLLQDSLGGNAITYMIACVTPAEFHLSETLNTVQYAQRARAIQSKPRIQQVTDESDKQAVIERLKAEIAFLRQQIRNSEGGERKSTTPQERGDRLNEREIELQNQVLDMQESYTALSQRHAKLISEITKSSDMNGEMSNIPSVIANSSVERLERSHSFAASVEQVVLEYEKTIQSLESSLSTTRASLANTESSLLERETKCAYIETVNGQLQARVQKMMEREANTENYLHDLEAKLDGHTFGEEKNVAIMSELRKEIARARENEASCEDYISTLEERLAEADQDMELMQREIGRLEHVVDRQRSLGKLDNLLHELDSLKQNGTKHVQVADNSVPEPIPAKTYKLPRTRGMSLDILAEAVGTTIPESDDDFCDIPPEIEGETQGVDAEVEGSGLRVSEGQAKQRNGSDDAYISSDYNQSLAQAKFVAEKLDSVTQELFDLRMQHDTTVNEYELLAAKYEEALRTLAELQGGVDESPPPLSATTPLTSSRPTSFLEDARANGLKNGERQLSSRSLSSELSLAGESTISHVLSSTAFIPRKEDGESLDERGPSSRELESMRQLLQEHQDGMAVVAQQYAQLQAEHDETLGLVKELRAEVQRARSIPSPPPPGAPSSVIRRMTSQNPVSTVDRAHRPLAALRNIAVEEFEDRPEAMQNFELNLNTAMHELHTRIERIQVLEAENSSVKKEMETKSTIISGLTRERSSLQASPVDMSIVSQMRDQLFQQEKQIKELEEAHGTREKELLAEIKSLVGSQSAEAKENELQSIERGKNLEELRNELAEWKDKLQAAAESLQSSETQLNMAREELQVVRDELSESTGKEQAAVKSFQSSEAQLHFSMAELETLRGVLSDLEGKDQSAINSLQSIEIERDTAKKELETLRGQLSEWKSKEQVAVESLHSAESQLNTTKVELESLRNEMPKWKNRSETAVESLQFSEKQLSTTRAELEAALASLDAMRSEKFAAANASAEEKEIVVKDLENERSKQHALVENLKQDIEDHKSVISRHLETIAALEATKASLETKNTTSNEQLVLLLSAKATNDTELDAHHLKISTLEREILTHQSTVDSYNAELESLRESQKHELAELESYVTAAAQADYESQLSEHAVRHEETIAALRSEISEAKEEVTKLLSTVSAILNTPITPVTLADQIQDLLSQKQRYSHKLSELVDANEELQKQLESKGDLDTQVADLAQEFSQNEAKVNELAHLVANLEETLRQKEELIKKMDTTIEEIAAEKQKSVRLVEELEEQITSTFDQHHNRLSTIQQERTHALEEANAKVSILETDIETYQVRIEQLELQLKNSGVQDSGLDRTSSLTSNLRKSSSTISLPSPPPAIPLPPLPPIASSPPPNAGSISPPSSRHASKELVNAQLVEDQEARIRTIEKHLYAEKQLTATLEEALGDLEAQSNKIKADMDAWKKKAWQYEDELQTLRKERNSTRLSLQAVEEERNARREAEAARAHLEERMNAINKKKKKSTLNCF